MVEVREVTKEFDGYLAVEDISFTVNHGDLLAIIGPNGSGKSTLVKLLIGLETPTRGSIMIDGKTPRQAYRRIGYVPQFFPFDRTLPLTVREFLHLVPCQTSRHQKRGAISDALQAVGMAGSDSRPLGKLSGGQLQRILIARALMHERDLLFLDEPSAGIDVAGETAVYELIKKLNEERGVTAIVISHELDFVMRYAKSVLCINQRLVCHGLPKDALRGETLEALYGSHMQHIHHEYNHP